MPKGTRVSRCVDKVKKSKDEGAAIAICQASTKQGYATGKTLKEALATKFGSMGSKLSRTSSRHATNPGESKAEARDDAKKFTKKHGQQASQTHKQTGKIPGPKPGEKNEQVEAYRDLAYRIDELLPALAAGAARVGAAVGRGVATAGKGAARMLKRKTARKAIASAQGVATGGDTAKKQAELGQQAASDKDLEETKMNNTYLNKLMEMKVTAKKKEGSTRPTGAVVKSDAKTAIKTADTEHGQRQGTEKLKQGAKKAAAKARFEAGQRIFRHKPGTYKPKMEDHTEYHTIGALMAEAMGLIKVKKDTGADEITKAAGDPEAHERRHTNIPAKAKLAKRTPLTKKKPGESTAQAIRRSAEEKGKAGKNPRG